MRLPRYIKYFNGKVRRYFAYVFPPKFNISYYLAKFIGHNSKMLFLIFVTVFIRIQETARKLWGPSAPLPPQHIPSGNKVDWIMRTWVSALKTFRIVGFTGQSEVGHTMRKEKQGILYNWWALSTRQSRLLSPNAHWEVEKCLISCQTSMIKSYQQGYDF